VSSIIAPFARTRIIGYPVMVLSMTATAFIGFGVWVHHMFATGLPQVGQSFFTAASMLIVIPTGAQMFLWIATIWRGRLRFDTPMLFVLAFIVTFVIGGLTGVMLAAIPLDIQVHDTFFVVAHLHYVLIGGAVFPLLGAVYFWFPKLTGRMLDDRLGRVSALLVFVGFNVTFFPQHQLGLDGMPRRIFTYAADTGWGQLNMLSTIGAFVLGLGVLSTVVNAVMALRAGPRATANPWPAEGLEWTTESPPPRWNFLHLPALVPDGGVVSGVRADRPEQLVTTVMDALPDHRTKLPGSSSAPLYLAGATAVTFIAGIFTPWAFPVGAVLAAAALIVWFWPRGGE